MHKQPRIIKFLNAASDFFFILSFFHPIYCVLSLLLRIPLWTFRAAFYTNRIKDKGADGDPV